MEDHTKTDKTLDIARDAARQTIPKLGVVIQSYLRRSADDIERLIANHTRVRLCKGAYDEPGSVAFTTKRRGRRQLPRADGAAAGGWPLSRIGDP